MNHLRITKYRKQRKSNENQKNVRTYLSTFCLNAYHKQTFVFTTNLIYKKNIKCQIVLIKELKKVKFPEMVDSRSEVKGRSALMPDH